MKVDPPGASIIEERKGVARGGAGRRVGLLRSSERVVVFVYWESEV